MSDTYKTAEKFTKGKIGFEVRRYWNPEGVWPTDFNDPKQNPWGAPRELYCPTIDCQGVVWDKCVGFATKESALEAAKKFQDKCVKYVEENHGTRSK